MTPEGKLAIYISPATIPAIAFGLVLEKLNMPDLERNVAVVAWNTIIYAILMLIADMFRPQTKRINDMTLERPFSSAWRKRLRSFRERAARASP